MHLNPHTILPLLCMVLAIICGTFVILQNPKAKLNRIFLALCITFAAWFSFYIPLNFYSSDELLVNWFKGSLCFISFIPITSFTFISTYLQIPKNEFWFKVNSTIGLTLSILSITTNWIVQGLCYHPWYRYPHAGILYPFLILHCASLAIFAIKIAFDNLHNPSLSSKQRNHVKYMISAMIALSFGMIDFIGNYNIPIYHIGYIPVSAYLIITTTAMIRHQLMDIKVIIKKSLVYTLLITVITIFYLICIFFAEHILQSMFGYKSLLISIISATFIAIAFIPLRNFIQNFIEKTFFRGSYIQIAEENQLLRQEIIQSERLKSIAVLASGMAHEIKNPLTPIKTFSEQLPSRLDDKEFLLKFSRIINKEVERIDSLVQELLSFAKPSPPQLKQTNIHQLIEHTLELLNNEIIRHKINLNTSFENKNMLIPIDPPQIKQALLNIFLNAIEAMPHGGTLSVIANPSSGVIASEAKQSLSTVISASPTVIPAKAGIYTIEISDTGCGITPEDLKHIFDPFFTKKDHGTGLGLSITYEIIKNHHGKILAESELDKGTNFRIELPL